MRRLRLHQKLASSNVVWYLNTATVLKLLGMNLCRILGFLGMQYVVENSVHLDCAQVQSVKLKYSVTGTEDEIGAGSTL